MSHVKKCSESPVTIAQLVGQYIIIYSGRGSNPGHPTYSPYKMNSNTRLPDKKKSVLR